MFKITGVVKHLLFINIIMFLASEIFGLTDLLALHYPASDQFEPFQIVTHFFMHGGFLHILFNMFMLVMFGSALEALWGPKRFLLFYFACALGAALLHTLSTYWELSLLQDAISAFKNNPTYDTFWAYFNHVPLDNLNPEYREEVNSVSRLLQDSTPSVISRGVNLMQEWLNYKMDIPVVGASGAIFGLLMGFVMYFPNAELMLLFPPIPVKAKYLIPILMVVELFLGVNQFSWDNIAHFAHLGGAITGLLMILYWRKIKGRY
jgi:membrane associated rhomboid family serine protease